MRRLARSMRPTLDPDRITSLLAMLTRIASVEGGAPSERQEDALAMLRRTFG